MSRINVKRIILGGFVLVGLVIALGPWVLYRIGLSGISGYPQPPVQIVGQDKIEHVWRLAHGTGHPHIKAMSPHGFLFRMYQSKPHDQRPDELISEWVATNYCRTHRTRKGMLWWHLSSVSLAIWISRNWTEEQIFSQAAEIYHREIM
jgi:hypothetical protein